jgi:hypothetical protein
MRERDLRRVLTVDGRKENGRMKNAFFKAVFPLKRLANRGKEKVEAFMLSENGESHIVSIILIIIVVIAVVAIFRTQLTSIVTDLFAKIRGEAGLP